MRFGFISHIVGHDSSVVVLQQNIELAILAEELGFDSFLVAQHHFGAQQAHCPSPLVLLSAIAQHTSRIRLGTAVVVGSMEHPLRLAEDAAMVDALSGGRLELGLGAGSDEATARRFGVDHARRHELFRGNLDILCDALTADSGVVPAVSDLRARLWIGTASESGFALAAECGLGVLTGRSSSPLGPRDEIAAARSAQYRCRYQGAGASRVGVSRSILCAASAREAFAHLRPGIERSLEKAYAAGRFPADFTAHDYVSTGHSYIGTGLQVREALSEDLVIPHATDVLCNVQPASPSYTAIRESLRIFSDDVIAPWNDRVYTTTLV
ncbi:LLM class flavin-dependent oxidoreductase [Rhodococcus sp. C3V]|uniref:LLM class flavin-dependent oxidoreductase n=1 Tax=Rhodococcus sp. C3V TaxID=3034165 RepID=UPI0023E33160|nr:LLM class flavin-dependent oxidoreductase [Rhodococcus sp. C3V]MDF3320105.1 LLM class flavin-dependent oxidoreductase [Rhodococcus sp. C3V]